MPQRVGICRHAKTNHEVHWPVCRHRTFLSTVPQRSSKSLQTSPQGSRPSWFSAPEFSSCCEWNSGTENVIVIIIIVIIVNIVVVIIFTVMLTLTSAEKRMYAVISFLRSNFFFPGVSVLFTDPMLGILKFYNDFVFCSVAVTLLSVVSWGRFADMWRQISRRVINFCSF